MDWGNELFRRNIGMFTAEQQMKLKNSSVAIAGLGGVGGITAERLARLGIGTLHISDPDHFEPSNSNRQALSNIETYGKNKAEIFEVELLKINPQLNIETWSEGVTKNNVMSFVDVDIAINAIEYNLLQYSVDLHSAARDAGKTVLAGQALGYGATVFVFEPDGVTFHEYIGLPINASETEIKDFVVPADKFCPQIPQYVEAQLVDKIVKQEVHIPAISLGCMAAASLLLMAVISKILKIKELPAVPAYLTVDFFELF
ncbi:MAG: ThiF family adenylyltransferase [Actinobacteria bacterium]|nr:ThiF family adenylyltransferase [Actinomycetota bacterium]